MLAHVALAISLCAASVSAFQVFSPSKEIYWVVNEENAIVWDCNSPEAKNLVDMHAVLRHPTILGSDADRFKFVFDIHNNNCHASVTTTSPELVPATGYTLEFTTFLNLTMVTSTSEPFEIKPKGTAVSPVKPPTLSISAAQSVKPHWTLAIALGVAGVAFAHH